jgi:hypothetical protein
MRVRWRAPRSTTWILHLLAALAVLLASAIFFVPKAYAAEVEPPEPTDTIQCQVEDSLDPESSATEGELPEPSSEETDSAAVDSEAAESDLEDPCTDGEDPVEANGGGEGQTAESSEADVEAAGSSDPGSDAEQPAESEATTGATEDQSTDEGNSAGGIDTIETDPEQASSDDGLVNNGSPNDSDPYFVRGGQTFTFLNSGGDCSAASDPLRCSTSLTPIQAALDDVAMNGPPDDRIILVDGGLYDDQLTVDAGLFAYLDNLSVRASGLGGSPIVNGSVTLAGLSGFELFGLLILGPISVQDSSNVSLQGTDTDDVFNIELNGTVENLSVDGGEGSDAVTLETSGLTGRYADGSWKRQR